MDLWIYVHKGQHWGIHWTFPRQSWAQLGSCSWGAFSYSRTSRKENLNFKWAAKPEISKLELNPNFSLRVPRNYYTLFYAGLQGMCSISMPSEPFQLTKEAVLLKIKMYDAVPCLKLYVQRNNVTAVSFTHVASQFHPLCHVETETCFLPSNILVTNQMVGLIFLWQDDSDAIISAHTPINAFHVCTPAVGIQYHPTRLVFLGFLEYCKQWES